MRGTLHILSALVISELIEALQAIAGGLLLDVAEDVNKIALRSVIILTAHTSEIFRGTRPFASLVLSLLILQQGLAMLKLADIELVELTHGQSHLRLMRRCEHHGCSSLCVRISHAI